MLFLLTTPGRVGASPTHPSWHSRHYRWFVATSVQLEVTAIGEVSEDRSNYAPAEVRSLIKSYGQDPKHGMSRRGTDPWRYRWQLTGPDRVEIGRTLQKRLRDLGYDADVSFWP